MIFSDLPAYPCCPAPSIQPLLRAPEVNTLCLRCGRHWYGSEEVVCVFSRGEWDRAMNEEEA